MKNIIKQLIPRKLLSFLGLKKYKVMSKYFPKSLFKKIHGYKLKRDNPRTFNEKLEFRKKYGNREFMALIADKYKVRDYVKEKIGDEYLIPLLGVYDRVSAKDLEKLPNQFVIKTNHASGSNHIEIVRDKSKVDLNSLAKKMNNSVKEKFGKKSGQSFYNLINPKILIEELLLDGCEIPEDYKFQCFKSEGEVYVQVDKGRYFHHKRNIYDENYNFIDLKHNSRYSHFEGHSKPKNFDKMKEIVKKLSEDFDYVRVDLYSLDNNIYFGELTQTHGNGHEDLKPLVWDEKWGELWDLEYQNERLYEKNNPLSKID